jgi:hypothetical protein
MSANPKKMAQGCHKLAVLAQLMLDALDDIKPILGGSTALIDVCKEMNDKCEEVVKNVFGVQEVSSTTYMQELVHKIDTCIRKEYKFIPAEKIKN